MISARAYSGRQQKLSSTGNRATLPSPTPSLKAIERATKNFEAGDRRITGKRSFPCSRRFLVGKQELHSVVFDSQGFENLNQQKSMKKLLTVFFSIALSTAVLGAGNNGGGGSGAAQRNPNTDSINLGPTVDETSVIVQLTKDPLSTHAATKPAPGRKIDFNSNAVRSYRAQLAAERNDFKRWLNTHAPRAKVTGQYDISLNAVVVQLNGTAKATIEQAPQARRVEYQGIYYPTVCDEPDPDLALIHAIDAWAVGGGPEHAGEGVKVAVIDSGIDVNHPCFDDTGYPPQPQLGDTRFTNNKVIAAKVFINKHGYTAEAIDSHGTHVAGTVGCNFQTPATVSGAEIPYCPSGVAPRVLLGNYNVFPADVASARSEDILNALETAYTDGFDIANMSLGGGAQGNQDLLTHAVDDLDQAGFISAIAAGNSGPGDFTIESPGSAARALTAGASSVGHFVGAPVSVPSATPPISTTAAPGDFNTVQADLTAPLGVVFENGNLGFACSALPPGSLTGKIAVISRGGGCSFSTKIRNAENAGAVAALIVNNLPGSPIAMGQDGTPNQPTIPAYMVGLADKNALVAADGLSATIGAAQQYTYNPADDNFMAAFSSQGPTDVDFRVKPDVVAPGVNVLSSIPVSFCGGDSCWAFFQGTSMATPHLAGSAAIVKWQHNSWSAAQIRSAIVNTADQGVLKQATSTNLETNVNKIGSGLDNLLSGVTATVALDPVSVSFGPVPSGSGQTRTFDVTLTNLGNSQTTFSLSVGASTGTGVIYSVTPSVTLDAGASGTATVTMTAAQGASLGGHQAKLAVSTGSELAHAAVFTFIR
jgi:subtilisin family serine protease